MEEISKEKGKVDIPKLYHETERPTIFEENKWVYNRYGCDGAESGNQTTRSLPIYL